MTSPNEAARAFVARLTELVRSTGNAVALTDAVAELIAAERAAVREACAAECELEGRRLCRDPDSIQYGVARHCAAAVRELPVD